MSPSITDLRPFNRRLQPVTLEPCVNPVCSDMAQGKRSWLCAVNVAIHIMMRQDPICSVL